MGILVWTGFILLACGGSISGWWRVEILPVVYVSSGVQAYVCTRSMVRVLLYRGSRHHALPI
jgi:formate-dependent nitrite reductase membrane component NrfD